MNEYVEYPASAEAACRSTHKPASRLPGPGHEERLALSSPALSSGA